jgi:bacterioferritin-associated ferredoxin
MNVCDCLKISVEDVEEYIDKNKKCTLDEAKTEMKIGSACSCCLKRGCKKIDSFIDDVFFDSVNSL